MACVNYDESIRVRKIVLEYSLILQLCIIRFIEGSRGKRAAKYMIIMMSSAENLGSQVGGVSLSWPFTSDPLERRDLIDFSPQTAK